MGRLFRIEDTVCPLYWHLLTSLFIQSIRVTLLASYINYRWTQHLWPPLWININKNDSAVFNWIMGDQLLQAFSFSRRWYPGPVQIPDDHFIPDKVSQWWLAFPKFAVDFHRPPGLIPFCWPTLTQYHHQAKISLVHQVFSQSNGHNSLKVFMHHRGWTFRFWIFYVFGYSATLRLSLIKRADAVKVALFIHPPWGIKNSFKFIDWTVMQ